MVTGDKKNPDQFSTGTWLISFADLITLLVCAFILYFAQHSHVSKIPKKDGPQVAATVPGASRHGIVIYSNDVLKGGGELPPERIKVVKDAVDLGFYAGERVLLSLCQGAFSKELASNFLTLLRDSGVPDERIDIRFFGTSCSAGELRDPVHGEPAARLEILKGV